MTDFKKKLLPLFLFQILSIINPAQDLKISELMSSNRETISDDYNEYPDWFELINIGESPLNLVDYFVSDKKDNLLRWQFPEIILEPNNPLVVFASGNDQKRIPNNWIPLITDGDVWNYIIPNSTMTMDWKDVTFDDSEWNSGESGIGFGDNDDRTQIPEGSISVFMRKTFMLTELDSLHSLFFHIDFDDSFVAYLNGTEIARMNIGKNKDTVSYDQRASDQHEAQIILGGKPEKFDITRFIDSLQIGENVLAVQVHNISNSSSDFSAIPFLTAAFNNPVQTTKAVHDYLELPEMFSHTNFKLSSSGESLYLTYKDGQIVDSLNFDKIPSGYSFGRKNSTSSEIGYLTPPTPGEINVSTVFTEKVESQISFSTDQTFFNDPFQLEMTGAEENEVIRYTLNGDEPTANSEKYVGAVNVSQNTIIRANIFRDGALPGFSVSKVFIFDNRPELPVISVSSDTKDLWDNETGMYVLGSDYEEEMPHYGANYWENWEKPAAIEMINKDGVQMFSANCGIKIFGGWSRTQGQKSLSVFFRNEYGTSKIENVKLFESKPITEFSSLVLRNGGNDGTFGRMRDGMMTSLVRNLNTDIPAYQPTVLYLNGEYWGMINLREKINEEFLESNHGVDADSVDLLQWNASIIEGSNGHYVDFISFLEQKDSIMNADLDTIAEWIDVENYIDYQLSQIYFNNRDWPGNNIKYWRPQTPDGKWRWIIFDTDFGFNIYRDDDHVLNTLEFALAEDGPNWPNPPWSTFIFRKLLGNKTFRHRFINRYADILNTTFQPDKVLHHIDSLSSQIESEMAGHVQKWQYPWNWQKSIQNMKTFAERRTNYVRAHIKNEFDLKNMRYIRTSIFPYDKGTIKLNTIEISDKNWEGLYYEDIPINLTAKPKQGYKFLRWMVGSSVSTDKSIELNLLSSVDVRVFFEEDDSDGNSVVINEINYNSSEQYDAGDWIELYNWGKQDIDISAWFIKDNNDEHIFIIPDGTMLRSSEYLVICRDSAGFTNVHSNVSNYIGAFNFGLGSSGDAVRLFDKYENLVDEVVFSSTDPWPAEPNGSGNTLELRQYFHDNLNSEFWRSSLSDLGTPGKENSVTTGMSNIENHASADIKVFPNPSNENVRFQTNSLDSEILTIMLYSLDGKCVYKNDVNNFYFDWDGKNMNGNAVKPGLYFCKIQTNNQIITRKIIRN